MAKIKERNYKDIEREIIKEHGDGEKKDLVMHIRMSPAQYLNMLLNASDETGVIHGNDSEIVRALITLGNFTVIDKVADRLKAKALNDIGRNINIETKNIIDSNKKDILSDEMAMALLVQRENHMEEFREFAEAMYKSF